MLAPIEELADGQGIGHAGVAVPDARIDAVHRYDGYVAQPTSDEIFARFGAAGVSFERRQLMFAEETKRCVGTVTQAVGDSLNRASAAAPAGDAAA